MPDKFQIDSQELGTFILEAKKNTWAKGIEAYRNDDGSKEFLFQKGLYIYKDRYFEDDPNPFIGQETVSFDSQPIWGMNYYGWLTEKGKKHPDQEGLAKFLQAALRDNEDTEIPFRGSYNFHEGKEFEKGKLHYMNGFYGNILKFEGDEEINLYRGFFKQSDKLYHLEYHGGII